MALKINYLNKLNGKIKGNIVFFLSKNYKFNDLTKIQSKKDINKIIKNFNPKTFKESSFLSYDLKVDQKIIFVNVADKSTSNEYEQLGANFFDYIKKNKFYLTNILGNSLKSNSENLEYFIHGLNLKSYEFNIYKTKKKETNYILNIVCKSNSLEVKRKRSKLSSLKEGTFFCRDLVSEPGNILHPDEYAKRLIKLKKYGLKVTVYDNKKLKKLGCNALLGVGQGSIRGSYLVTIEWKGKTTKSKPLAFVGKGVCFDTGGISLKPARFMEDMTYDMAGSAVVVGLMKNFALRKAKINAIGVVGLVENMPGSNAQRPGDIVKSYSGKTIEVLNTDAEGRLVLADALTFTERKFKPNLIIDLATLTGAIIVSLGSEYAGLFSNDDKLSKQIFQAGEKVGEKVWRLPLHKNYDKLMDSKNADMQNINYVGGAGSTTAAQFLQRFIINKTPWAHLDIAGMAFSKYAGALNSGGATGFGVRLLNKFVEENYE
tara:strand:- start:352 stop:1812 length:1461 start_codon:yes stop_codon:yes gene_type:complete